MDVEELQSDLHALKILYELLINDEENDQSVDLEQVSAEIRAGTFPLNCKAKMDEKARSLLKKILDGYTEKILKSTSEVIATNLGVNTHMAMNPTAQSVASEQSKVSISPVEPPNQTKRCQVCHQMRSKQLKSTEERKLPAETENISKDIASYKFLSNNVTLSALEKFTEEVGKKPEDTDPISKEACDAVKIVEARISALQVVRKNVDPLEKRSAGQQGLFHFSAKSVSCTGSGRSASPTVDGGNDLAAKTEWGQVGQFVIGRKDPRDPCDPLLSQRVRERKASTRSWQAPRQMANPLIEIKLPKQSMRNSKQYDPCNALMSHLTCQNVGNDSEMFSENNTFGEVGTLKANLVPPKKVKAMVDRIESMSKDDHMPSHTHYSVQGNRIPVNWNKKANKNVLSAKLTSESSKENVDGNQVARKESLKNVRRLQPSISAVGPNDSMRLERRMPDKKHAQFHERRDETRRKINSNAQQGISFSEEQESGSTSSSLSSSSCWTTQENSTSSYSPIDHSGNQRYSGPTSNSESDSSSESEMYSVRSGSWSRLDYSSSSEHGGYLPSDQSSSSHHISPPYRRVGSTSGKFGRTINYRSRSTNRKKPDKQVGLLKKLKNKLPLIFHHHHHHYHHHHRDDDGNHSDLQSQLKHGTTLKKHGGSVFNRKSSNEGYGEHAVNKLSTKKLHRIVDGLMRHVGHSKKSKARKGGNQLVSKKVVKKVNWWKTLRHHGRMKMSKKPHVKLVGTKKNKMRALPTIKWR